MQRRKAKEFIRLLHLFTKFTIVQNSPLPKTCKRKQEEVYSRRIFFKTTRDSMREAENPLATPSVFDYIFSV